MAMTVLGNGLSDAQQHADALSVKEADLSTRWRLGESENNILLTQTNLAITYTALGRHEEALQMDREVYSGRLKLSGAEHRATLRGANNYANCLLRLQRFKEARALMRKKIPVARRVLGESYELVLMPRTVNGTGHTGPSEFCATSI